MSTRIEDLVRHALEHQADRAPTPERIRAAVPVRAARRARRQRYGTVVAVAAAAAVTAAIAVPTIVLRGADPGGFGPAAPPGVTSAPPALPSASGASAPTGTPIQVPLGFRPTWLPPGLMERSRFVPLTADAGAGGSEPVHGVERIWTRDPVGADVAVKGPRVGMSVLAVRDGKNPYGTEGTPVDINGHPGRYVTGGPDADKAYLHWMVDSSTAISIDQHRLGLALADLARIARSVRPDPAHAQVPLLAGWLPAGLAVTSASMGGDSPTSWSIQLAATRLAASDGTAGKDDQTAGPESKLAQPSVDLVLGTAAASAPGAEAITVNGRPARYSATANGRGSVVVVELPGGLRLSVSGTGSGGSPISREDLIRVAEHAEVAPQPDLTWVGAR